MTTFTFFLAATACVHGYVDVEAETLDAAKKKLASDNGKHVARNFQLEDETSAVNLLDPTDGYHLHNVEFDAQTKVLDCNLDCEPVPNTQVLPSSKADFRQFVKDCHVLSGTNTGGSGFVRVYAGNRVIENFQPSGELRLTLDKAYSSNDGYSLRDLEKILFCHIYPEEHRVTPIPDTVYAVNVETGKDSSPETVGVFDKQQTAEKALLANARAKYFELFGELESVTDWTVEQFEGAINEKQFYESKIADHFVETD
ncbi:hypothetical protein ACQU0X_27375 [Pseudovibrio ascidiaceicola]|uniref:hypothetical protein n=1 Tax=Pseudovibrio ascidiaceicola TaxID=285279 RepID=UPI003D35D54E